MRKPLNTLFIFQLQSGWFIEMKSVTKLFLISYSLYLSFCFGVVFSAPVPLSWQLPHPSVDRIHHSATQGLWLGHVFACDLRVRLVRPHVAATTGSRLTGPRFQVRTVARTSRPACSRRESDRSATNNNTITAAATSSTVSGRSTNNRSTCGNRGHRRRSNKNPCRRTCHNNSRSACSAKVSAPVGCDSSFETDPKITPLPLPANAS